MATPSKPLSFSLATATSKTGDVKILPFTILFTILLFFSNTRKSLGPKNAILVGRLRPSTTVITFKSGSLIDGVSSGSISLSTDPCAGDVKLNTNSTIMESNKHQIRYDDDLKWSKR